MLKVGLIGAGHLGRFHLNNWKEIDNIYITGFYDPDDKNAELIEKQYEIKRFQNAEELIQISDAIDIAAPTNNHFHWAEMAIKKSKHVFIEKPLAETVEQARLLVDLVQESGVKLQVGHVERFNPAILALKNFPINPMFIEVHRLAEFNPRGTEVSVIMDLMIHDIDIILSLVKSNISNIAASGVAVITDTLDIANARIEFTNGCVANLTSSRISLKKMRKMRLFQKDAYIGIDFLAKKSEVIKLKEETDQHLYSFDIETKTGKKSVAIASPASPQINAIKEELTAFKMAIENNTRTAVNEIDGWLAMDVAYSIAQKASNLLIKK